MLSDHRLHRVLGRPEQGGRAGDIHRGDVVEPAVGSTEAAPAFVQPSRRFRLHHRRTSLPISLGGGGRVGAELSLSEGLRLCLCWLWLWLLEARFSNTRSLLPMGQPRTLPTGSSCISHTSPPPSE